LGNVSLIERPFHPRTLASVARAAIRSRRRQYQARELLERYELLARELQHRTKNLLAVILSIAGASLRDDGDGPDVFVSRLHALQWKRFDRAVLGNQRDLTVTFADRTRRMTLNR
jgi:two-component sensor histidine kinase